MAELVPPVNNDVVDEASSTPPQSPEDLVRDYFPILMGAVRGYAEARQAHKIFHGPEYSRTRPDEVVASFDKAKAALLDSIDRAATFAGTDIASMDRIQVDAIHDMATTLLQQLNSDEHSYDFLRVTLSARLTKFDTAVEEYQVIAAKAQDHIAAETAEIARKNELVASIDRFFVLHNGCPEIPGAAVAHDQFVVRMTSEDRAVLAAIVHEIMGPHLQGFDLNKPTDASLTWILLLLQIRLKGLVSAGTTISKPSPASSETNDG